MAETFDCPKCGAPLNYNPEEQDNRDSFPCPYCGETVIVPAELRSARRPQEIDSRVTARPAVITIQTESEEVNTAQAVAEVGKTVGRSISSCLIVGIIIAVIVALVSFFAINSFKTALVKGITGIAADSTATPIAPEVSAVAAVQTQLAPLMKEITKAVATMVPTAAMTPTDEINTTATAEVASTRAAQNLQIVEQRNWPVVLQDKFINDQLDWTVGIDNNNLALEERSIAASKYTWKMTTKKSMGSFSFPTMHDQTDVYVSVDMQVTTSSGNSSDEGGIIFRSSQTASTFYFFGVNPDGTYSLSMYDGSQWNDLIPITETSLLNPTEVNHLAVSMQGSQILLVINNTVIDNFEDSSYPSGIAGIGVNLPAPGEDSTMVFTNFYVRAPKK